MRPLLELLLLVSISAHHGAVVKGFSIGNEALLIERAKAYAANPTPDDLADDFIFRGPVIGPLNKADFCATLSSVGGKNGIKDAFPDLQVNQFGFCVDPTEPGRVWYMERPRGHLLGHLTIR